MSESFDFVQTGRFTVGALGEPGRRVFYFQVFADGTEVAVKCEKQQAQALGEHLAKLLADLPGGPPAAAALPAEALPPSDLTWIVGSISLGVDPAEARLVVVLEEMIDPEDPEAIETGPAQLRVRLTAEQVQAYLAQVEALVAVSRPVCRLCEHPIDPSGHACPRLN